MHVVAVMYRKFKAVKDVTKDKKMIHSLNWHGGCSHPC